MRHAEHPFPPRRALRLAGWGAVVAASFAAFYTFVYLTLLARYAGAPPAGVLAGWQAVAMLPLVPFIPVAVWLAERPRGRRNSVISHFAAAAALTVLHMLWFGAVTPVWAPYEFLDGVGAAINHFVRYHFLVGLLVYGVVGYAASRAATAGFTATSDGLLRDAAWGADTVVLDDSGDDGQPSAVIVFAPGTLRVLAVNERAVERYGRTPADFKSLSVADLFAADTRDAFVARLGRATGKVALSGRARQRAAGGEGFEAEYTLQAVTFRGAPAWMLASRDISAQRRAEEALRRAETRAVELRAQLADAQLRALRLQVNPHFLFNILNTVAMMIRTGNTGGAQDVVTRLGSLFRRFLDVEYEDRVTLEMELEFLDQYLSLEQLRFADRMRVRYDIEPAAARALVPTLILQSLAENAVKHGVAQTDSATYVDVRARRDGDRVILEVENDDAGRAAEVDNGAGHGIGVANTRSRLREFYGAAASFELVREDARARAVVTLPFEQEGDT